jgi:hypothetical protein
LAVARPIPELAPVKKILFIVVLVE